MLAAFSLLAVLGPSWARAIVFAITLAYVGISVAALRRKAWAVFIAIGVAAILLARWLPMVVVNLRMYFEDHPVYIDSPGTILVVAIYSLLFALPALILLLLYLVQWRQVVALLHLTRSGA
jgi:hypothetical protein